MVTKHFFVDEAGDLTLFDKKGRSMLGREGVSRYFMVGVAEIRDPIVVADQLNRLRLALIDDPYFSLAPSLDPERRKTALAFHAKDDLPEVRWRVYKLLRTLDIKVTVAVRHKTQLEIDARTQFERHGTKLRPEDIYDDLVTRLFTGRLTLSDEHYIAFALHKKSCRTAQLSQSLKRAWKNDSTQDGIVGPKLTVSSLKSCQTGGLQVVDYFLWAVQRLFERFEDRFYAGMEQHYDGIIDIDGQKTTLEVGSNRESELALRLRVS